MNENQLSNIIIGLGIEVHTALGPGLLENVYKECLYYKIKKFGLKVEKELPIKVEFEEVKLECGCRLDLLVEDKLVLELKAVEELHPIHFVQLNTYLKLGDFRLGLLMNFNSLLLKDGIKRVVNKL